jgi:hypothetical protein
MQIEIWHCEYLARCKYPGCAAEADVLERYVDEQGRFISQTEFCHNHLSLTLATRGPKVHDRRGTT